MSRFLSSVQDFFHSITTNDHYASYNSGYKNSPHGGRRANDDNTQGLVSSAAVNDEDGFASVGIMYNNASHSSVALNDPASSTGELPGTSRPSLSARNSSSSNRATGYTPGMRSSQVGNGAIQLQDYSENGGLPPPPAPSVSWKRIDRWLEYNFPELEECVTEGATAADLNELENDLDCTLPLDVRDSYMIHDGQESGGRPCGLVFGLYFMNLEEIAQEWEIWKNTAVKVNTQAKLFHQQQKERYEQYQKQKQNVASSSSESLVSSGSQQNVNNAKPRAVQARPQWMDRQDCLPPDTIQKVYAHPGWIPLIKDNEGNNIAVDLAPGRKGRWGQVILFGRDFDRKYVIAPSFASFLAKFADDLELNQYYINDNIEESEFWFCAPNGKLVRYLNVLRSRVEKQFRPPAPKGKAPIRHAGPPGRQPHPQAQPQRSSPVPNNNSGSSTPIGKRISSPSSQAAQGKLISPVASSLNLSSTANGRTSNLASPTKPITEESTKATESTEATETSSEKQEKSDPEPEQSPETVDTPDTTAETPKATETETETEAVKESETAPEDSKDASEKPKTKEELVDVDI